MGCKTVTAEVRAWLYTSPGDEPLEVVSLLMDDPYLVRWQREPLYRLSAVPCVVVDDDAVPATTRPARPGFES